MPDHGIHKGNSDTVVDPVEMKAIAAGREAADCTGESNPDRTSSRATLLAGSVRYQGP